MQALQQHQITLAEYFSIGELQNKTELINGVIYDMVPPGPNHSYIVGEIAKILIKNLDNEVIRQEQPIQFFPDNAPQPDIAILKPEKTGYRTAHPQAKDVIALIEVSDSTLKYDSGDKMSLYAQENIPLYFIVDLKNKQVLKYSEPEKNSYKKIQKCQDIAIKILSLILPVKGLL